jgi:hypothetical protein
LFLTETATTDGGTGAYAGYDAGFEGALYEAAEVTQLLPQRLANVDWFTFQGGYAGAWVTPSGALSPTFHLFSDVLPQLGTGYLPTRVAGYPGVYAAGTIGGVHAYAVLVVNTNVGSSVTFPLAPAGFTQVSVASVYWPNGASLPQNIRFNGSAVLAPLSVALLYQSAPPVSGTPGPVGVVSLVGLVNPAVLVDLGGVSAGIGAVSVGLLPPYWKILGGASGAVGLVLLFLVI